MAASESYSYLCLFTPNPLLVLKIILLPSQSMSPVDRFQNISITAMVSNTNARSMLEYLNHADYRYRLLYKEQLASY